MSMRFITHRKAVQAAVSSGGTKGATKVALDLQGRARRLTPVDTGRLRSSIAYVVKDGTAIIGTNVAYAVYVHEDLAARHPTGQAKYIETPAREHLAEYQKWLRDSLADEVRASLSGLA